MQQTKQMTEMTHRLVYLIRAEEEHGQMVKIAFPISDLANEIVDSYKAVATYQKNENRLTLDWESCDTTDTYYVYRYNPETKRLSKERTVTGKTECNYRKVEAGKSYYFIVSTKELSEKAGYTGAFSAVFTIPNN